MSFSDLDIRKLSAADAQRGWTAIPDECPPEFKARIVEQRAQKLGFRPAQERAETPVLQDRVRAKVRAASIL